MNRTGRRVKSLRLCPWPGIRPSDANNSRNSLSIRLASSTLSAAMRRQISKRSFCASRETSYSDAITRLLSQPRGLSLLHLGPRLLRRQEITTLELAESSIQFFGELSLVLNQPRVFSAQHFQRPFDDFVRTLVAPGLNRLGDYFF